MKSFDHELFRNIALRAHNNTFTFKNHLTKLFIVHSSSDGKH